MGEREVYIHSSQNKGFWEIKLYAHGMINSVSLTSEAAVNRSYQSDSL